MYWRQLQSKLVFWKSNYHYNIKAKLISIGGNNGKIFMFKESQSSSRSIKKSLFTQKSKPD